MKNKKSLFLAITIILIAANLRAPLTMLGPIIPIMKESLKASNSVFGILTSLPLLAFAAISIIVPRLDVKFGKRTTLTISLILLIVGLVVRSIGLVSTLLIGTVIAAIGIGISNVLLPGIIVHTAPEKEVGKFTGLFTLSMGLFGAIASGVGVYIAKAVGWKFTLGMFVITAVIAWILWLNYSKSIKEVKDKEVKTNIKPLLKSKLVWAIIIFMGAQAWIAYAIFAWVPSILIHRGMSDGFSGLALMLVQLCSIPTMYIIPVIAGKRKKQSTFVAITTIVAILGCLTLFTSSMPIIIIGLVLIGIGQGASLSFAYLFFAVRTNSAKQTSELSGLAQAIGYLIAATGPILFGDIHTITHAWTASLGLMIIIHIVMFISGIISGRDKKIAKI